VTQEPIPGLGRLIDEVSRSHTIRHKHTHRHTPSSTPLNTQQTRDTNIHALKGIRTGDPSSQASADLRLRPRRHLDRRVQRQLYLFLS
jgi:hypothetical protein